MPSRRTNKQNKKEKNVKISKLIVAVMKDECGGEVIEYALILGLITVAAIGVVGKFGTKVLARWGSVNSSM